MEEVWPPELAALLDRAPPAELAALGARCPLRGVIFADSTGSVMDVAVDMIRMDRG
jgi:hypothetical protein